MQRGIWEDCLSALRSDLTETQFNTWIKPLSAIEDESAQTLTLLAPNKFVVSWVQKNYLDQIKTLADKRGEQKTTVAISVGEEKGSNGEVTQKTGLQVVEKAAVGSSLNPNYRFETFVGGKSNQLARAAAVQITENPGTSYNPFFIYGGVGLGKTHLMQSVGNELTKSRPETKLPMCTQNDS